MNDIQELTKVSPWVEVKTVAMLAVALHGGLKAHNELCVESIGTICRALAHNENRVKLKTQEEDKEVAASGLETSRTRLSEDLRDMLKRDPVKDSVYGVWEGSRHSCGEKCVAQFFPVDDYGWEAEIDESQFW